jgi:broad specificity phosphatase PhoE
LKCAPGKKQSYPLNETGIAQAEEAAKRLREQGSTFDRVFSNPLTRAIQMARIVASNLEPVVDDRLIEMDYSL